MKNKITIRLSELIDAGILSSDKAQEIQLFYTKGQDQSQNRLFVIFGVLGAILVGLGIILILAHNWDELSRITKTIIAFIPLLLGQGFCAFSLSKKADSQAWKEASAAFLFFAVGACISLISQIYNIPGNLSSFVLTWMLLCLPLVYIMRSSIVSLMYLIGITYYTCETGYWNVVDPLEPYLFWALLIIVLPHYHYLYKNRPNSNFMVFHNWLIPLSVTIVLGTIADRSDEIMFVAYLSLLGLFYLIGYLPFFKNKRRISNGYPIIGSLGTVGILLFLSFEWFWDELETKDISFASPEFFVSVIISIAASALLFWKIKNIRENKVMPMEVMFILFIPIFFIGLGAPVLATILINLLVFTLGVLTVWQGAKENHLGILNYGLLIITALVICRFFDTNISFVLRGILFLIIGFGFFFTNYWMLQKRKGLVVNGER
ncbi:MAG: DUF2157 domain-containing protein [Bacteroidota bacterium]